MKKYINIIIMAIFCLPICAQKGKEKAPKPQIVKGEYTYYAPDNVTPAEAKRIALYEAKCKALEDEFGIKMRRDERIGGKVVNGQSDEYFFTISNGEVSGEWLETIDEPEYYTNYEDDQLVVKCTVKGKARKIEYAPIDLKVNVLRNGTEDKFASTQFKHNDDLYLSLRSPINGYLAIYLEGEDDRVYCLLPYSEQKDGIYPVEANRRYVFFDPKSAPANEKALVEEHYMTCDGSTEFNQIYVIFSSNPFVKPVDSDKVVQNNFILPRQLPSKDFHKWLSKCRTYDVDMNVQRIGIIVEE